jgi:hypothetical protein
MFEEYVSSVEKKNIHSELVNVWNKFPVNVAQLKNIIVYGPPGIGKYSQVLYLLKKYSPSQLKYEKKITVQYDKQQIIYHISDIHYEIDMSLLGCNSKNVWHEIFFQIIDIISMKSNKTGIILCKNFHHIHSELLEIFYSYIQQYNHSQTNIKVVFLLISENISFIPNSILNSSHIIRIKRPSKQRYSELFLYNMQTSSLSNATFIQRIIPASKNNSLVTYDRSSKTTAEILQNIDIEGIMNIKELRFFDLIESSSEIPKDVFNIICDNIIKDIQCPDKIVMTVFRDKLYDLLTYNLDMNECLWYIIIHFIENNKLIEGINLQQDNISNILIKTYSFFKHFNNNYRPIFHLESIMYYIINNIHNYR